MELEGVGTLIEGVLLPAIQIHLDILALHHQGVDVLDLAAVITPLLLKEGTLHGLCHLKTERTVARGLIPKKVGGDHILALHPLTITQEAGVGAGAKVMAGAEVGVLIMKSILRNKMGIGLLVNRMNKSATFSGLCFKTRSTSTAKDNIVLHHWAKWVCYC